jgi:hypothetical protein
LRYESFMAITQDILDFLLRVEHDEFGSESSE